MPDATTLAIFATASLVLVAFPGPSVAYIVARSLEQGRTAGLVAMLGIEAGGAVHVLGAALGLAALLASSPWAFAVVKYAGAAYLVWIGVRALRSAGSAAEELATTTHARRRLFVQGLTVNVLNPKTAMFLLAFLPQFVDPSGGAATAQVLVLGAVFLVIATVSDGAYAVLAAGVGERLRRSASVRRTLDRLSGCAYVALGAAAALTGERPRE